MTTKKNYNKNKSVEALEEGLKEDGIPIDEPIENLIDLVADHPTVMSEHRREKRFIYLHPNAWTWLELLAEHKGLSTTEYIEASFRPFGEPSLEAHRWLDNRKRTKGLLRSRHLPDWNTPIKGKGLRR